jgi:hypothetical protein
MTAKVINDVVIDVAVLCKEYSPLEIVSNDNHIVHLDEIDISESHFRQIFYPYGDFFGIKPNKSNATEFWEFITFHSPWRTVNGRQFSLLDEIIRSAEQDLNVSRNCFTTCSIIELTNEISNIKTLYDIDSKAVLTSLTWTTIISLLRDNTLTKITDDSIIRPLLIINMVFKNSNPHVKPTMVKFPFRLESVSLD